MKPLTILGAFQMTQKSIVRFKIFVEYLQNQKLKIYSNYLNKNQCILIFKEKRTILSSHGTIYTFVFLQDPLLLFADFSQCRFTRMYLYLLMHICMFIKMYVYMYGSH